MSSLKLAMFGLLILCLVQVGCGGMSRDLVLTPIVQDDQNGRDTGSSASAGPWVVELDDLEFHVSPVLLSSKLVAIFGPGVVLPAIGEEWETPEGSLRIGLSAKFERNSESTLNFDPREFLIILEDGRSLSPVATQTSGNSEDGATIESVTFTNGRCTPGCGLLKLSSKQYRTSWPLEYDIALTGLAPFTLHPGVLIVNGEVVQLPPISFVHGESISGE